LKDQERLTKALKTLFRTQSLAVLATQSELQPYTNLVAFTASDDLKELLFATTRATRKYANLASNPRAAMLVDNRSNRLSDFSEAMAVTALGAIEEVQSHEKNVFMEIYLAKHPNLEEFVHSPSCAHLWIRVNVYYIVERFQNVMELHIKP